MNKARTWTSFFEKEISISVRLPIDWNIGKSEDFQLLLLAPEVNGYSVNVAINQHEFKGELSDFEKAIASSNARMETEYPEYEKKQELQCWIDGCPAYHQVYSWKSDEEGDDTIYVQTLTLIYDMASTITEVNGTTLKTLPAENLTLLEDIVGSIRLIDKQQ